MALGAGIFPQYPHHSQTQMNISRIQKRDKRLWTEDWLFEMNGELYAYSTMPARNTHMSKGGTSARTMLWTTTGEWGNEPTVHKCVASFNCYMPLDPKNPKKGIEKFLKLFMLTS